MPTPCSSRARKLFALAIAVFALAGVSAQQPDPLLPLPPKPPGKADILPVLREARALPELPPLPGSLPLPSPGPTLPPLPGELPALPGGTGPAVPLPPLPPVLQDRPGAQPLPPSPPVKYVNKPDVEFDFEVTKKGRAGVKSVSLWVSDPEKRQPTVTTHDLDGWKEVVTQPVVAEGEQKLRYKLPADGRHEFFLQVIGGNDRKSIPALHKGTWPRPDLAVVLDTKPPAVKDVRLEPPGENNQQATIRWAATDANLGEKCVKLEYEQKPGGAWVVILENAPNNGYSPWLLNDKLPISARVRVTVTDLAGNTATATSETPTNLDPVVPEGRLTGVRGVEPPAPPPLPIPGDVQNSPGRGKLELPSLPPMPPAILEPALPAIPKAKG